VFKPALPSELMPGVGLRRAVADDLSAIVALLLDDPLASQRGDFPSNDLEPYRRAFIAIDADPAHCLLIAHMANGAIVATAQLTVLPCLSRNGTTRLQVEAVKVRSSHRSRGIGRALLEWIMQIAPSLGVGMVQLTTDPQRPEAIRFYEKNGFVASHIGFRRSVQ
jgi:GNAT superfamily N-acetyltransferase